MEVDEEVPRERRIFTAFERHDEFVATQNELLRLCEEPDPDDREQRELLRKSAMRVRARQMMLIWESDSKVIMGKSESANRPSDRVRLYGGSSDEM